jgi:hypothetical protein
MVSWYFLPCDKRIIVSRWHQILICSKSVGLTLFLILNSFFKSEASADSLSRYSGIQPVQFCQVFSLAPQLYQSSFGSKIIVGPYGSHRTQHRCHCGFDHCCIYSFTTYLFCLLQRLLNFQRKPVGVSKETSHPFDFAEYTGYWSFLPQLSYFRL